MIDYFNGKENGFLSNFYPSPIEIDNLSYDTVEHYFQSLKASTSKERKKIRLASDPGRAKMFGRRCNMRKDWTKKIDGEVIREKVMYRGVLEKFKQHPNLLLKLKATGTQKLLEGNSWHDNIWGDCFCPRCSHIKGKNLLGKILMSIRKIL